MKVEKLNAEKQRNREAVRKVRLGELLSVSHTLGELEDYGVITLGRGQIISKIAMRNKPGVYPVYSSSAQGNGEIGRYGDFMFEDERLTWSIDGGGRVFYRSTHRYSVTNVCGWLKVNTEDISTKYLYYLLSERWSSKEFDYTHKAHPSVIRNEYKNLKFPLIHFQRKIAAELDRICELKKTAEKVVEKLQLLVKSRFVEMFGTKEFENRPLSSCVKEMFIGPFGSALKNECFVAKDNAYCMVYEQKHAIRKTMEGDTRYVGRDKFEELKRFTVLPGDLIVSCRGTIGEIYRVPNDAPIGIMHPSIMKIRLDESAYDTTYFVHALSKYMKNEAARANGSSVKMAVTATALGKELFPLPPLSLQREFAAFVSQVDKLEFTASEAVKKLDVLYRSRLQEYFS